jgi:hypothetical protein
MSPSSPATMAASTGTSTTGPVTVRPSSSVPSTLLMPAPVPLPPLPPLATSMRPVSMPVGLGSATPGAPAKERRLVGATLLIPCSSSCCCVACSR